jgi:Calcineurin-like phosphoesterase
MARGMVQRCLVAGRLVVALALFAVTLAFAAAARAATGVLAIGDFGVGGDTELHMGAAMKRFAANRSVQALITLGDNDYTRSPRSFHRNWVASFGWAARRGLLVAGTLGNHDYEIRAGRYEFDELGMPRRYYRRRIGNIAFFLLDSNRVTTRQTTWLHRVLARSTARWKVAAFHHPPFTCGGHSGDEEVAARWVPLFRRYGVDLVLGGHDHNYQRFSPRGGVTYVVHGGGGAALYSLHPCPAAYPTRVVGREIHGWLHLRATNEFLRVRAVGPAGHSRDSFVLYP